MKEKLFSFCLPNLTLAVQFRKIAVEGKAIELQEPGSLRGKALQNAKGKPESSCAVSQPANSGNGEEDDRSEKFPPWELKGEQGWGSPESKETSAFGVEASALHVWRHVHGGMGSCMMEIPVLCQIETFC